jgi:O-antigen/teichoic acid export membrane protein
MATDFVATHGSSNASSVMTGGRADEPHETVSRWRQHRLRPPGAVTVVGLGTPFLLWRLGARDYGLWLTGTQLIACLTLLDVGVLALLPRETAYATGRAGSVHDATDLPEIIGRTTRIVVWQLPLIAAAAVLAWWFLPGSWGELRSPMALLLGAFVLTYPLRIFQATLQGFQDLAYVGSLQIVAWGLGTAVTVLLVLDGVGLMALAAGAMLTQLVSLSGCTYRVATRFSAVIPRSLPNFVWRDTAPYLQRALWVSVSQVAQLLLYATDVLIVAWVFGPITVVPYACTQKLISVLSNQPQVLSQAAGPALSELRMGATREKLFRVTSSLSPALMLAWRVVIVVVAVTARSFPGGSARPYGGAGMTALFAAAMLVRHWNTALVYSLFSFGYERRISLTTVGDGLVTLGLSLALARTIGVVGVPIGFLAGALLVSLPANLWALARETGVSPVHFASALKPWAIRLALLVPLAVAANLLVRSPSFIAIAVVVAVMSAAYAALMLPIALRPPLGEYVYRALGPLLKRFGIREAVTVQTASLDT